MNAKLLQLVIQLKDEASAALGKLQGTLNSVGGFLSGAFTASVVAAGIAIAGLAAGSLTAAADFETATANFASVAGGSLAEAGFALEDVKAKALDLGATTAYSAGQAQDAMIALAKGGVPVIDIMGNATAAALDLAAAGSLELAPAADIVAKQLGVWGSTGVTAADVANQLSQAANASTVDVDELALGLANVGGVAKASGVSFTDLNQTMAMLSPGFSSAADAGTSLKTLLISLQPKSKDAAGVMKELSLITTDYAAIADDLGVTFDGSASSMAKLQDAIAQTVAVQSKAVPGTKAWDEAMEAFMADFEVNQFYDANGAMKDMGSVAELLQVAFKDLSEEQKTAAMNTIFGTDAFRAAAMMADQGRAGFDAMGQAMAAAGSAAEQAAIKNKTFAFAWDSLKGSIETVQIIIGGALLPVLTDLTNNVLIPAVNEVMALAAAVTTSADPWGTFVTALNSALPGLGSFVNFVVNQAMPILAAIGTVIMAVVVPGFYTWATAAATAMWPIYAIAAAVGLLVAAWTNNWFGIQEVVGAVWDGYLQPALAALGNWLGVVLPIAGAALVAFWSGTLAPALAAVGSFIMGTVVPALVAVGGWLATNIPLAVAAAVAAFWAIVGAVQGVATSISTGFSAAVAYLASVWLSITTTTSAAWAWITSSVQAGVAAVVGAVASIVATVSAIWASITATAAGVWAGITGVVQSGIATLSGVISTGLMIVSTIAWAAWNTLVLITSTAWSGLVGIISPIIASIVAVIGPPIMAVVSQVVNTWLWGAGIATSVWNAFAGAVSAGATIILGVLTSIGAGALSLLSAAWASIQSAATSAWAGIVGAVSAAAGAIGGAVSAAGAAALAALASAWASVQSTTAAAWQAVVGVVSGVLASLTGAISSGIATAQAVVTGAWGAISTETSSIWTRVQGIVEGAIKGVQTAINTGIAVVQGVITGAWSVIKAASENDFGSIPKIIETAWNDIKTAFSSGVEEVKKIFGGLADDAISLGGSVVTGLVKGIKDGIGAVADAARSLAQSALDAAMGLLDSHSPSRKFAEVGITIPQGVSVGITKGMPSLNQGVNKNLGGLVDQAKKTLNTQSMANQVGKPVVDGIAQGFLSGVASAKSAIQSSMDGLLNSAKSALQISSPSKRSANEIGSPIVMGVIQGIVGTTPKATDAMLDLASKMFDVVSKGVGAFADLRQLGTIPQSAITQFADSIQFTLEEFAARVSIWDRAAMSAASQFTFKSGQVVEFLANGVELLSSISALSAPSSAAITQFANALSWTIAELVRISTWEIRLGLMAGVEFAAGAGQIVGIIKAGVDALNALSAFVRPAPGVITTFVNVLGWLVSRFVLVAQWISADAVSAAATFATGAGQVLAIVKDGVDAFLKLGEFVRPPAGVTQQFADMVGWLVSRIVEIANWIGQRGAAAAGAFAEHTANVLAIVKDGVDAFLKLGEFVRPPAGVTQQFANMVGWLVSRIVEVANWIGQRGAAAAAAFADNAGKVLGILKAGVEGLHALRDFTPLAYEPVVAFGNAIDAVIWLIYMVAEDVGTKAAEAAAVFADAAGKVLAILKAGVEGLHALRDFAPLAYEPVVAFGNAIDAVIWLIYMVAEDVGTKAAEAAAVFADGAGKVIGLLKAGVDGFNALADLGPVSDQSIQIFAAAINLTMQRLGEAAALFSADAIAHAGKFATAAGSAVGILEKGVQGLALVNTFGGTSEAAITRFGEAVRLAVGKMAELAAVFGVDATAAANAFAKAAGEATDFLKKGVDGFAKLGELTEVPKQGMDFFARGIIDLISTIIRLSGLISTDTMLQANQFANAIDLVITVVKSGLDALGKLGLDAANIKTFTDQLVAQVNALAAALKVQARPAATDIGLNIALGIADGISAGVPAIQNAVYAAVNAALAAARAALGIASPSTVFDEDIGQMGGAGLARGFDRSAPVVAAAASRMASAAVVPAQAALRPVAAPVGGGGGGAAAPAPASPISVIFQRGAIVQQPGESGEDLANRVVTMLEERIRLRGL